MARGFQVGCIAVAVLALSGCQSVSSAGNMAQVRVIVASPNAPGMDLYADTNPIAYNLTFGNVTTYVPMSPGGYTVSANTTGTRQVLTTGSNTFGGAGRYTILLGDTPGNLQQVVLSDQNAPAPVGQAAVRFLDQATAMGPVDLYLVPASATVKEVAPLLAAQGFGANSGYVTVPAGAYRLLLYPAGTAPAIPLHTGPLSLYGSGSVRTVVLLDQRMTGAPLQVITANDF